MTDIYRKEFYIRFVEILLLLYCMIYCIDRNAILLMPIYVVVLEIMFMKPKKSGNEIGAVRLSYICFCIHVVENDFYQIFSDMHSKYIFLICTIVILIFYNRSEIEIDKISVWLRMILDTIVTCQFFGYACFVIAKYKDVKIAVCFVC